MPAADGLHPPVAYAGHWTVLAVLLLLLAAGAVLGVLRATRTPAAPGPVGTESDAPEATVLPAAQRRRAHHDLDEAGRRYASGDLDDRGLALAVSATVREAAATASGVPASALALADLRTSPVPQLAGPVAAVVAACYPPAFAGGAAARGTALDATALLAAARAAVDAWT
ncbi:hypothetical protein [Kineococcus rubinsiae]|uniref:hypothetical protein n=1 Tax=Kineococcus rubinsiae TaxID=2609562 RepID=UPI001431C692|nr:hypothetical protein [Kineococcus rubinsiae]NIZ93579.1 hypothetical protein [Kineococcus rubinsiae]